MLKKYSFKETRKFWVAVGAALGILGVALSDGIVNTSEIIQVVIAFGGSLGVFNVSNKEF